MDENGEENINFYQFQFAPIQPIRSTTEIDQKSSFLFRYFNIFARASSKIIAIPYLFTVLRILQGLAVISLVSILEMEDNNKTPSLYQKILRLFIPKPTSKVSELTMSISFFSIFLFAYGYIHFRRQKIIGKTLAMVIYILAVELPTILASIITHQFSIILSKVASEKTADCILLLIIFLILLFTILFIDDITEITLFNSLFYFGGRTAKLLLPTRTILIKMIILFYISFSHEHFTRLHYYLTAAILYIWYGIHGIVKGRRCFFVTGRTNTFILSNGVCFLCAGIATLEGVIHKRISNPQTTCIVIIIIYFASAMLFSLYFAIDSKKKAEKLIQCGLDFNEITPKSVKEIIQYQVCGFTRGIPCTINGQFLEWCIRSFGPSDLLYIMARFASLVTNKPYYLSFIKDSLNGEGKTIEQKYIIWEYLYMKSLKATDEIPSHAQDIINESLKRCKIFPDIEEKIAQTISSDTNANFILSRAHSKLKKNLDFIVWNARDIFPNSILVLRMVYEYQSKVIKDKDAARITKEHIHELQEDNRKYVDVRFMEPLSSIPYAQKAIFDYNECEYESFRMPFNGKSTLDTSMPLTVTSSSESEEYHTNEETKLPQVGRKRFLYSCFLIVIYIVSMIFLFYYPHRRSDRWVYLEKEMVNIIDAKFIQSRNYVVGSIGSLMQINGDGNEEIGEAIKQAYPTFVASDVNVTKFQNIDTYENNNFFQELLLSSPANVSIFNPGSQNGTLNISFTTARSEYYDYIYEVVGDEESAHNNSNLYNYLCSVGYQVNIVCYNNLSRIGTNTYQALIDKIYNSSFGTSYFDIIPLTVCNLLFIIYIIYSAYSITKVSKKIPQENKENMKLFNLLLKFNKSFKIPALRMIGRIIIFEIWLIIIFVCFNEFIKSLKSEFSEYMESGHNDFEAMHLAYAGVSAFEYDIYSNETNVFDHSELVNVIQHVLSYYLNGNDSGYIKNDKRSLALYNLIYSIISQKNGDSFNTSLEIAADLRKKFLEEAMPGIDKYNRLTVDEQCKYINRTYSYITELFSCFFIIIIYGFAVIVDTLLYVNDVYNSFLSLAPVDSELSKFNLISETRVKNQLLSMEVSCAVYPCIVTTDDYRIVAATNSWIENFEDETHKFVGKVANPIITTIDKKFICEKEIGDELKFISVNVVPEEIKKQKELELLREKVISYREDIGFISGSEYFHKYNFVSIVAVVFCSDVKDEFQIKRNIIQECIANLLETYSDYKQIRTSCRECVCLFGATGKLTREQIICEVISFALNLIMKVTDQKSLYYIAPKIVVSSGDAILSTDDDSTMNLSGSAVNKLMPLVSSCVTNSITICELTMNYLRMFKWLVPDEIFEMFANGMYRYTI